MNITVIEEMNFKERVNYLTLVLLLHCSCKNK